MLRPYFLPQTLSREAQLFVGWVSGSVNYAGVGFHASTQPTFILYLIPPTYLDIIEDNYSARLLNGLLRLPVPGRLTLWDCRSEIAC